MPHNGIRDEFLSRKGGRIPLAFGQHPFQSCSAVWQRLLNWWFNLSNGYICTKCKKQENSQYAFEHRANLIFNLLLTEQF
jgi:hypothetical protein